MSAINLSLTGYKINVPSYSNKLEFVRIRLALHHILEIDIYIYIYVCVCVYHINLCFIFKI